MELVSPAGNLQKLQYVYEYGADAAYIGLKKFSLRVKADNFYENEYESIIQLKERYPGRRLFCALRPCDRETTVWACWNHHVEVACIIPLQRRCAEHA